MPKELYFRDNRILHSTSIFATGFTRESVTMLRYEYARSLSVPHKAHERTSEYLENTLGYYVYMFKVVESQARQLNHIYGDEFSS